MQMIKPQEEMRYSEARRRMVALLQSQGLLKSARLIEIMNSLPRHFFVDEPLWEIAYQDRPLPIGEGQTISHPSTVALMLELLEVEKQHRVLEIGTGSGYQTAILAEMSGKLYSVEWFDSLAKKARSRLDKLRLYTARIEVGDGSQGWPSAAPFDRIIVSAGSPETALVIREQLAHQGRLVIPVGSRSIQRVWMITRDHDQYMRQDFVDCTFVDLLGRHGWAEN